MIKDFIYFASKDLKNEIGDIQQDAVKCFWSDGKWSTHELLLYLIDFAGPCNVYLSTFSISEIAVRALYLGMDEGKILNLHCLFDMNIKRHKSGLMYFADHVANEIILTNNHSKVFLIENSTWKISVLGSANMTPNPRKEAGAIFSDKKTFDFYLKHLSDALTNGTPATY